jgi:hypothetical protein
MVNFAKHQKQPVKTGSIPEDGGAPGTGSIPPTNTGNSKGKGDRQNKFANEFKELKARVISLEIAMSMQAAKSTITNDALWTAIKENAHLAGVRNLIDYISRRNTKGMTPEQLAQLEDKRGGLTGALAKIINIILGSGGRD